ncbi:hypothetical protein PV08_11518 [Exophiala spinifera]|uniref:Uncharacterized protein n=1 Tax=Exophiala spinifera TaxID=91928 RepID=A0A0D2BGV3_9EURO|nr:uncharacterized protein PV08_11518 [Exophiala spinifera]KIW10554.1 hypothetical protein PV08_11518 [Exophiala spinifera]
MRRCFEQSRFRRHLHCFAHRSVYPPKPVPHYQTFPPSNTTSLYNVSTLVTRPLSTVRRPKQITLSASQSDPRFQFAKTQRHISGHKRGGQTRVTKAQKKKPEYWIALLDGFLPKDLSLSFRNDARTDFDERKDFENVFKILQDAKSFAGLDLLAFMALGQGRHKAVVYLAEILLKPAKSLPGASLEQTLPSNIAWPQFSFSKLVKQPIELDAERHVKRQSVSNALPNQDSNACETGYERVMPLLWQSLAELVIASIRRPQKEGKLIIQTVLIILAKIHHVDLIPSAVYTYAVPKAPTNIQHSPILSLLNSRILSTLSDAVWQAQQEDELAKAATGDASRHDLTYDEVLPGGRFRLELRELGPEVWVEFILWCCVEGGYPSAGARIIRALRADTEYPWSAVHWTTSGQNAENPVPSIDWDRVRRRPGGSVGGFEAYSREDPFVQMQPRTISTEVVLALVDCLINSVDSVSLRSTTGIGSKIWDVLSFLEPHGLAPSYFDYLAVRLLQTENFGLRTGPHGLENWALTVSHLRSLRPVKVRSFQKPSLTYDYILKHTMFQAGFWHQVLQAYIESHRATKAVEVLTRIQQLVDTSKLEAIGEFMSGVVRPQDGFFTSRPSKRHTEYIDSHGQLPEYKLLLVINLVTSAKLFGLSDWLLHSSDVDGPLIPVEVRGRPSIASGLSRHAIAKDDLFLLRSVVEQSARSDRKPTVNLLRALANAQIHFRAWGDVSFLLQQLKGSETGGYSPSIIANLAASILRLEVESKIQQRDGAVQDHQQAEKLLIDILSGRYNAPSSDFTVLQRKFFRQQVNSLLHVLQAIPDSSLEDVAAQYLAKYPVSNLPQLDRATFNVIFSAIVEVKGALEGRRIWEMFCTPNGWVSSSDYNSTDEVETTDAEGRHDVSDGSTSDLSTTSPTDDWSGAPLAVSDEVLRDNTVKVVSEGQQNAELSLPQSLGLEDDRNDIPFVSSVDTGAAASGLHLQTSPVVVPDLHTLQILVNAALSEKESDFGQRSSETQHTELDDLLAWATAVAKSWGMSSKDIETELNIPAAFHSWILAPYPGLSRKRQAFMDRHGPLDVSSYFMRGLMVPRAPSIKYGSMNSER